MNTIAPCNSVQTIASEGDTTRIIETLISAFRADPTARWLFPNEREFSEIFGRFARAFAAPAFEHRTAHFTDELAGAAAWFAPGVQGKDEAVIKIIEESVPKQRLTDAFGLFEQMDHFHPEYDHWYLPLIGVTPGNQGKGIGSRLLQHVLRDCDRSNIPAYLESSNSANLTLYRRHGFRVLREIQSGSSPIIYPMLRDPQPINNH